MLSKIKRIIETNTFRQSVITSSGTFANGILSFIFYTLTARQLGPESFGVLSFATVTIALIASIANFGVDTGIVRFVGKYIKNEPQKAYSFLKVGLKAKIISGLLVIFVGWLAAPFLAEKLFAKPDLILALRLSLIGSFAWMLFYFILSTLQAMQKFVWWSLANILMNSVRIVSILLLLLLSKLDATSAIITYSVVPLLAFFVGILFLPPFYKSKTDVVNNREFMKYNSWVFFFTIIAAFSSRLDTFFTAKYLSLSQLGIYSVAVGLSSIVSEIVMGLATVVAPKLASFTKINELKMYLLKLQLFVIFLAISGVLVGIPISQIVIENFYGASYMESTAPFAVLLVSQALFLISVPSHTSIFYYFTSPKTFFFISLGHLILVSFLGFRLVPQFGYMGASYSMLMGNIYYFLIPGVWVLIKLRKAR